MDEGLRESIELLEKQKTDLSLKRPAGNWKKCPSSKLSICPMKTCMIMAKRYLLATDSSSVSYSSYRQFANYLSDRTSRIP
jgi:hypothetical protein